jgi:serine/threonine protein kinase
VTAFGKLEDVFTVGNTGPENDNAMDPTTRSVCGTPCYMAPEMLSGFAYGYEVDWWSFGIMVYAMLEGEVYPSPFHSVNYIHDFLSGALDARRHQNP